MSVLTSDIVDRAIRHARRLRATDRYDWPTARAALASVLADLEARVPGDPSLDRLRQFIAEGDRASSAPPDERKNRKARPDD
jgi:hypothetical protein